MAAFSGRALQLFVATLIGAAISISACAEAASLPYQVVGSGQTGCYDDTGSISTPLPGQAYFGQDAQAGLPFPMYHDNGDGTVSDLNTGLMWVKARGPKVSWDDAVAGASSCRVGGYSDWRAPTIKDLYSLINYNGGFHFSAADSVPYIDTHYFGFVYGDEAAGERGIDCQDWSSTAYVGTTMNGNHTVFGVNFADGRIKGYPTTDPRIRTQHLLYIRYVRGNSAYGHNQFVDNGDGTITDRATGLMWQKADSGKGLDWKGALAYAASLKLAGHADWRVPTAKQLQSIVDYTRAPAVTGTAAIDPLFHVTEIESFYWTSTTHLDGPVDREGSAAVYIAFGRATGFMRIPPWSNNMQLMDVHGAGAQRSDPKSGNPADYPYGRGPQGDVIRIYNYVRCVRSAGM